MSIKRKPKLAVWKFASCDGCQLSLLDCEDELLAVADKVDIAYFPEASSRVVKGPYDISLVEGSVTTQHDAERIQKIRKISKLLITIGACATAGGIQALRNFKDVKEYISLVYAKPQYIETLDKSAPSLILDDGQFGFYNRFADKPMPTDRFDGTLRSSFEAYERFLESRYRRDFDNHLPYPDRVLVYQRSP